MADKDCVRAHLIPLCRVPPRNGYRGREGLDAEWNTRMMPRAKEDARNLLFGDRTPDEIVSLLRDVEHTSGAVDMKFFSGGSPSQQITRLQAWTTLFGDTSSIKNAVRVVRREWGLTAEGRRAWKRLQKHMRENDDAIVPLNTVTS